MALKLASVRRARCAHHWRFFTVPQLLASPRFQILPRASPARGGFLQCTSRRRRDPLTRSHTRNVRGHSDAKLDCRSCRTMHREARHGFLRSRDGESGASRVLEMGDYAILEGGLDDMPGRRRSCGVAGGSCSAGPRPLEVVRQRQGRLRAQRQCGLRHETVEPKRQRRRGAVPEARSTG